MGDLGVVDDMSGFLLLLGQAIVYFVGLGYIFYKRKTIGIGVLFCVIGTLHFLETYLAAAYFIEFPFGLVSPGSTVLFTGKLAFFLLLYIKEDAENMREPAYGLLIGSLLMVVLALILRLHSDPAGLPGYNSDLRFLDQIGLLMVWGTALLFIDVVALVLIYERLGVLVTNTVLGRMFISLAIVLSFDQFLFYAGLQYVTGVPASALYGGWIAKIGAAVFFSLMVSAYLTFVERGELRSAPHAAGDIFDRLTYRHHYEKLAARVGKDALTGLQDRGQLDAKGPAMLRDASRKGVALSLMMIDVDHFKTINDTFGHLVGDHVLRGVGETLTKVKREDDELFRYGGEEFVLLCPISPTDARTMAERVRAAVERSLHRGLEQPVTVSIGIANFPTDATEFSVLLKRADEALYRAKALGRNRVCDASDPMT